VAILCVPLRRRTAPTPHGAMPISADRMTTPAAGVTLLHSRGALACAKPACAATMMNKATRMPLLVSLLAFGTCHDEAASLQFFDKVKSAVRSTKSRRYIDIALLNRLEAEPVIRTSHYSASIKVPGRQLT